MSDSVRPHRRQPTRLPTSLGFSRQEHWSGLTFPTPVFSVLLCQILGNSMDCRPPDFSVHGIVPGRTRVGCHFLLQGIFWIQGSNLYLLHWLPDSLPLSHQCIHSWSLSHVLLFCDPMDCSPPGSTVHRDSPDKNTGVDCHALLQGIFPTQELNPSLLHCRQILYCLSHQGSPLIQITSCTSTSTCEMKTQ